MQIKIEVSGNIAVVTDKPEVITTGTVGLPVLFEFDQSWEGLQKTAVFRCGQISRVKPKIDTATTVPKEVLKKPNAQLSIGVYGVNADGTIAIATVWANVDIVKPGADPEAEPDTDPALPVYQQLLNDTKDLKESLEWLEADTANELRDLKMSVADLIRDVNTLDVNTGENIELIWDEINNLSSRVDKIELSGGSGGNEVAVIDDTTVGADAWSSKKTVDTLCPDFTESGSVVRCEPVEGYPLQVVSHLDADTDSLELYVRGINFLSCDREISFTTSKIVTLEQPVPPGEYYLHIGAYTGSGEKQPTMIPYYEDGSMAPYLELGKEAYIAGRAVTFTKPVTQVRFYSNGTNGSTSSGISCTLLEAAIYVGNAKLPYEPYRSQVFTADFSKLTAGHGNPVFYDWNTGVTRESLDGEYYQHDPDTGEFYHISDIHNYESQQVRNILGFSGINCLNSTLGTVTVCGRKDLKELADKVSGQVNKQYELIEDITLAEDTQTIERNVDPTGNAYNFSAMRIMAEIAPSSGQAQFICTVFTTSPTNGAFYMPLNGGVGTAKREDTFVIKNDKGFTDCFAVSDTSYNQQSRASILASQWKNVTKIRLFSGTEGINLPAGTRIRIYGIRG